MVISADQWAGLQRINLPPYPPELDDFLAGDCTIWPGKKRAETHIVVPLFSHKTIKGKTTPLTLASLDELDRISRGPGFAFIWDQIPKEIPAGKEFQYGVMTNDVIPGSMGISFQEQLKLLPPEYEVPGVFDATRAILWENRRSGQRRFNDSPMTYTRCTEVIKGCHPFVGGFSANGLGVGHDYNKPEEVGLAGWRNFRARY